MKNETTIPAVPAGFTEENFFVHTVNCMRDELEVYGSEAVASTVKTIVDALYTVVPDATGRPMLTLTMGCEGKKFAGSFIDVDGEERAFVLSETAKGGWRATLKMVDCGLPKGFKETLDTKVFAAVNPVYASWAIDRAKELA